MICIILIDNDLMCRYSYNPYTRINQYKFIKVSKKLE